MCLDFFPTCFLPLFTHVIFKHSVIEVATNGVTETAIQINL
jgi:hypothetical protein